MLKLKKMAVLYDVLGVPPRITPHALHKRYLELACKLHPDKPGGDGAKFADLTMAYSILKDPCHRGLHDDQLELHELICELCNGTGKTFVGKKVCRGCNGTGLNV